MKPMRGSLTFAVAFLVACSSAGRPAPRTSENTHVNSDGLICREETPTGTLFSHEVCRTPEQMADEHEQANAWIRNANRLPPGK